MKSARVCLLFLIIPILLIQGSFGQSKKRRGNVDTPRNNIERPGVSAGRVNIPSPPPTRPTTPAPSTSGSSGGSPNTSTSPSRGYDPDAVNRSLWNGRYCRRILDNALSSNPFYRSFYGGRALGRCSSFFSTLGGIYGFDRIDVETAMFRFANGDTPLSPTIRRLALQRAKLSSETIRNEILAIESAIDRYESGKLSRREFDREMKESLGFVREAAKQIRKDYLLDYVDLNPDVKTSSYQRATSVAELRELVAELRRGSDKLDARLVQIQGNDEDGRVVSVSNLTSPSLDSMSKGIDRLAKTIKKSTKSL